MHPHNPVRLPLRLPAAAGEARHPPDPAETAPSGQRSTSPAEHNLLFKLIQMFSSHYQKTVSRIAPTVNRVAQFVPSRRERRLHVGLFGYSRKVGKASLPRAIGFTCALYSLGVPPELIGTGRGIAAAPRPGSCPPSRKLFPPSRCGWCRREGSSTRRTSSCFPPRTPPGSPCCRVPWVSHDPRKANETNEPPMNTRLCTEPQTPAARILLCRQWPLLGVCLFGLALAASAADQVILADHGKSNYRVVLPASAIPPNVMRRKNCSVTSKR